MSSSKEVGAGPGGGQEVTHCEKGSFCCCVESKFGRKGHYCRDPGSYEGGLGWREVVGPRVCSAGRANRAWEGLGAAVTERGIMAREEHPGVQARNALCWRWVTASASLICLITRTSG